MIGYQSVRVEMQIKLVQMFQNHAIFVTYSSLKTKTLIIDFVFGWRS